VAREGVIIVEYMVAFIISVLAGILAHYICKWLDGDDRGDGPGE
jgi:hypothetical protein